MHSVNRVTTAPQGKLPLCSTVHTGPQAPALHCIGSSLTCLEDAAALLGIVQQLGLGLRILRNAGAAQQGG